MKQRKERICNPCFEREIILVRLLLKSDSWYFAISNELAKQRYSEPKLFQTEEITTIQVHGERISSENRLEIERERETKERKNWKDVERVEKNAKWGLIGRRIGRTQWGEDDREQEKAEVKWRISCEDQREKVERAPENRLKRGQQQRETNYACSENENPRKLGPKTLGNEDPFMTLRQEVCVTLCSFTEKNLWKDWQRLCVRQCNHTLLIKLKRNRRQ